MSEYSDKLADVMRAEAAGCDLEDMGHEIRINVMREDGMVRTIGYVSAAMVYQDPETARRAIERIKFATPEGER